MVQRAFQFTRPDNVDAQISYLINPRKLMIIYSKSFFDYWMSPKTELTIWLEYMIMSHYRDVSYDFRQTQLNQWRRQGTA